ncbi:MAG: SLC13 family permease [Candidatus Hydrogenedentes bacterium]|nr:SLC13 family permease [Candidatus Hydrogenedentota bacterium]
MTEAASPEWWEKWFAIAVLLGIMVTLIRRRGPIDAILLGGALLMGIAGIISPEEVFLGFVNPGTLAIAALFIIAAAVQETGVIDAISGWVFGKVRTEASAIAHMIFPVASLSAFMNNTPIVAMLMPVASDWGRRNGVPPSRLLLPLSYIAILGGTCTLIGTATNLIISELISEEGKARAIGGVIPEAFAPLGMFEMAKVGVPFVLVGCVYLLFFGRRFLPNRRDMIESAEAEPREYFAQMRIESGCNLIGQNIEDAGLRRLPSLFLAEIHRSDQEISPVSPREVLHESDILTFTGVVNTMLDLERIHGLVPVADRTYEADAVKRRSMNLVEAVISPSSPLVGKNIRDADFRATYNSAVIAVNRGAERLQGRVGDIVLHAGDTLLLQTGSHFSRAHRNNPDFYLVSEIEGARPIRHDKRYLCMALLVLLVVLMTLNLRPFPVEIATWTIAFLMVATRCVQAGVARASMDWQTILTIGAAIALGKALENSGTAEMLASHITHLPGGTSKLPNHLTLFLLYALTGFFAETISCKAAAMIMFPIAVTVAGDLGVNPKTFIMATAFATAATFATPLGYPTNLMVYGPGGYKFTDFTRVGLPLTVILAVTATIFIPIFWPF